MERHEWRSNRGTLDAPGVPAARVEGFTIRAPLMALIMCLAILLPVLGASLLVLWCTTRMTSRAGA